MIVARDFISTILEDFIFKEELKELLDVEKIPIDCTVSIGCCCNWNMAVSNASTCKV
jgi:hypothetical protein